ncbi:glutathione S-transferase [Rhodoferax ferrireducens]|uniref:glutathione transferase n=1 Tax=Rhodoferax ferrireducens TaxID=192843 RepID=A0ABU2CEE3_9BURK|nr:glutathione S-transferase family protein [Rhodoferax ferrireducens]MDR7379684.1 glutathione S-transferase [Rhodoferax ferrireducens]
MLTLISHPLCPYVQRAAIVLAEKNQPFERIHIDLAHKPDWFLQLSPLGKTPVLQVDDQPIFESAVICEYLDDTAGPRLHPGDALERAQHRAWMEFGSAMLNMIAGFYNAPDEAALDRKAAELRAQWARLEAALQDGPYFAGQQFSMVDAVFGPVFRYFDVFDSLGDFGFFAATPKVSAWRLALAARPSVAGAVGSDYPALLRRFVSQRPSALARRLAAPALV